MILLKSLKNLKGVSTEKEILTISKDKVTVYYEFKNNTSKDIETYIAFPIISKSVTDYMYDQNSKKPINFTLQVNGAPKKFLTEKKCISNCEETGE